MKKGMASGTLAELCTLVTDGTHDSPKLLENGIPFIKGKHINQGFVDFEHCDFISRIDHQKVISRSKPERGDILFANIGNSIGDAAYVATSKEFSIKNVALFKPNPRIINSRYLYYHSISRAFQASLLVKKSGSAQPFLGLDTLRNHSLQYHVDIEEQERVADILAAYDNLIENNTRRVKVLEQITQMLYREWFVNFRFPGHEKVKMVESEMGMIPGGWPLKKLGDVLHLEYGKALKADQRTGGNIPVFGSSGVLGFHSERLTCGPGVIVGRKGNVGSVFYCQSDFWVIDTAYFVSTSMPLHFVFFNLCTQNFLNNDAAVPGLNRNQAHSLPIIVPDDETLGSFENVVKPVFELKSSLEKKNSNLRTTRDLLLPKLVSGEFSVEQIEQEVVAEMV